MKLVLTLFLLAVVMTFSACESQADRLNRLILQLADTDLSIQIQAYYDLVSMGQPAVSPLISALNNSGNKQVRRGAAWTLGQIGNASAISPLITALKDSDFEVRQFASDALGYIGKPSVNPLITALNGQDIQISIASARVLGQIGEASAVAPLIKVLQGGDTRLMQTAAISLSIIGNARATDQLIMALRDNDGIVRSAAARALVNIGEPAVEPLIAALYDDATYVIMEDETQLYIRQEAALVLGRIGDIRAIKPLIDALADNDRAFSRDAASALSLIGTSAIAPLISQLSNTDSQVVCESAWALGRIKDPCAVEPLISVIKNGLSPTGAHAAYEALTSMEEVAQAQLQAFLLESLQAQDLKTLAACYDFYISRGDPNTESALIAALNLYADAYGNYDDNGMVAIAERFLNCGNDNLHSAAISWGEGRSFNVEVTPFAKVRQTWGQGVYDSYLGKGMVTWGNKPFKPEDMYVLHRESPELPSSSSSLKKDKPRIVYLGGSTRYPVTPSSYQEKPCPDVRLGGVDVLTHGEPGVVSVGDYATWVANVINSSSASQVFEIKVKIDGQTLYKRGDILAPGENVTLSGLLEPVWQWEMAASHTLTVELRFGDSYRGTQTDCLAGGIKGIAVTNYRPWPPGLPLPYLPGYIDRMMWNRGYPSTEDLPVPPGLPR